MNTGSSAKAPDKISTREVQHRLHSFGVSQRVCEGQERPPRVAANDPALVVEVPTECLQIAHGGGDGLAVAVAAGLAAATLVIAVDLRPVGEHPGDGAEVVTPAGATVGQDDGLPAAGGGGPQAPAGDRHLRVNHHLTILAGAGDRASQEWRLSAAQR